MILLMSCTGISHQQANTLISLRPFPDATDFKSKLSRRNKTGLSARILEYCTDMFRGYKSVDDVLEGCERVGDQLKEAISKWTHASAPTASTSKEATPLDDNEGALTIDTMPVVEQADTASDYISTQPALLVDTVQLKEYQLLGVNWLNLLYQKKLSCILADEMGALTLVYSALLYTALIRCRFGEDCSSHRVSGSSTGTWSKRTPSHHCTVSCVISCCL
jgi:SWI/SNF-related matrix-associated actin-dependent regulator of chromatin subfamily A containing DEAD/H box 1